MNILLVELSEVASATIEKKLGCFGHDIFSSQNLDDALLLVNVLKQDVIVVTKEQSIADAVKTAAPEVVTVVIECIEFIGNFVEEMATKVAEAVLSIVFPLSLESVERQHIQKVLSFSDTFEVAADLLGINMSTLWRKRKQYAL